MNKEQWRPIAGFQYYEVSSYGRVRSLDKRISGVLGGSYHIEGRVLKNGPDKDGYRLTILRREGKSYTRKVHRLVLEAFVGPCPQGMECRHINSINDDNRIENLEWATKSRNNMDRVVRKTHHQVKKTHCNRKHALLGSNLVQSRLPEKRICLACQRARAYIKTHPDRDLQQLADEYYAMIQQSVNRAVVDKR